MTLSIASISYKNFHLTSREGTEAQLLEILLAAQGRGNHPTTDIDVWIREGSDPEPLKVRTSGAVTYLKGALNSSNNGDYPHFECSEGRLELIVNGKKYNPINNLRGAMFAVVSHFNWPPGKVSWLMGQLFGSNGHKKSDSPATSEVNKVETDVEAIETKTEVASTEAQELLAETDAPPEDSIN